MLDVNKRITVSIDQLTDIMAETASNMANKIEEHDKDMAAFAISVLAMYSAIVAQELTEKYATEEE